MNNLKQIRIQFGLTQVEMAQYLEIKRSLWSLCEIGKRDLPTQALLKFAEMELFLLNNTTNLQNKTFPHEAMQLQKAQLILGQHQKEIAFQQLVLQRKLAVIQKNYQYNIQLLQFLTQLEENDSTIDALKTSWITMMKTAAIQKIEVNGLHHQAKIILHMQMNIPQDNINFINNLRTSITNS